METFSALLGICAGNSPGPVNSPHKWPVRLVTRSFNVFFDLRLNERLCNQSRGWWFETLPCPLWRHRNGKQSSIRQHAQSVTYCWNPIGKRWLPASMFHFAGSVHEIHGDWCGSIDRWLPARRAADIPRHIGCWKSGKAHLWPLGTLGVDNTDPWCNYSADIGQLRNISGF